MPDLIPEDMPRPTAGGPVEGRIILCETPDGCTCGAPASTPAGMHHCDCAVHPGWCGEPSCLPCERNGHVRPTTEGARE